MVLPTGATEYFFKSELPDASRRVAVMELTYDDTSISRLHRIGVQSGWSCLDAGAGGGSIARWLSEQVGPDGHVTATELDVNQLADLKSDVIDIDPSDLRVDPLPRAAFDLVHTRLVLGHIREREHVLKKLIDAVTPGGYLFLEEADWFASAALGPQLHRDVMAAAMTSAESNGFAARWGRQLPELYRAHGLTNIVVDCDVPIHESGSPGMEWLRITFQLLNSSANPLAIASHRFEEWQRMAGRPGEWCVGMGTIGIWAQVPDAQSVS
ncbi:methyltransferase domain-containing protein [Streptomyces sioyaensis]|uniref:class I SAM-dependent methyltransferase n=1 Tax=Streptomyces sioyaensis TaxID=67364 RepID=UPI0033D8F641